MASLDAFRAHCYYRSALLYSPAKAPTLHTDLRHRIVETIRHHQMMQPGNRIGVAVSGGADSTALLCLLQELRCKLGITLQVIHLNHRLRGTESDLDEQFVAGLARVRGLEFLSERRDVAAEACNAGWNLEDAGRRARHDFFERLVADGKVTRVAVAHTADDQAETVLARILRGTGTRGLAGIHPVRGNVVRPLLGIRRAQLREYLDAVRQSWREDPSNQDLGRLRSRLRHDVIPELQRKLAPDLVERLSDLAGIFYDEEAFWSAVVEDCFRNLAKRSPGSVSIAAADLLSPLPSLPGQNGMPERHVAEKAARALSRRLVLRLVEATLHERGQITSAHVGDVLRLALAGTSGHRLDLPHSLGVRRDFNDVTFFLRSASGAETGQNTPSPSDSYEYVMRLSGKEPGDISVPELKARFCLKLIDWPETERETRKEAVTLDADQLQDPVVLRSWRPGDAYRPRGHRRVRKLKEMFHRSRVPARHRALWPVLTSAGEVVWARGMPPAAEVAANLGTRKGLVIQEEGL